MKAIKKLLFRVNNLIEKSKSCENRYDWQKLYDDLSALSLHDTLIIPETDELKALSFLIDNWLDFINENYL